MIAPLRRRHRFMTITLAPLLAIGLFVGVLERDPVPASDSAAAVLRSASLPAPPPGTDSFPPAPGAFGALGVRMRHYEVAGDSVLELDPEKALVEPDVLVYASASPASSTAAELPADAVLLGSLGGAELRRFELPKAQALTSVHLFSLGHAQLLASAALTPVPPATGDE